MNKIMQIKHVKDRKKNLAYSVFFSIEIDSVLAKLLTLMNNMNLLHSTDSVVFQTSMPSYRG